MDNQSAGSIHEDWLRLRETEPSLRAIDVAKRLGIAEAALLASACGKDTGALRALRLEGDWGAFIAELPKLSRVKAMTRNPNALIEVEGRYDHIEFFGNMGQSLGDVDLRIFLSQWKYGFAFREETRRGWRQSLQFFDTYGVAIHKLYTLDETDSVAFDALVTNRRGREQASWLELPARPPPQHERSDEQIDRLGLETAWRAMKSSHDFTGILRRFEVARTQALRLIGPEFAYRVRRSALESLLNSAAAERVPIMIFVGNAGIIQIYTGPISHVAPSEGWLNILDPHVDLHILREGLSEAWVVKKPTVDGVVTSLEVYSKSGEQIVLLVGTRKSGQPENTAWRALIEGLQRHQNV